MLPFLIAFAASAAQPDLPRQWATFSRSGALSRMSETVDIATGDIAANAAFRYTLRFTRHSSGGDPEVAWADSAKCPSVRAVIASMRGIKMPSPSPYGLPDQSMGIIVDGATYSLSAPSSDPMGRLTIRSNVGSSLALWIDASLKQLDPCWTKQAP